MRKLVLVAAVGGLMAAGSVSLAASASDPPGSPGHYNSPCQSASTTYQNSGSGQTLPAGAPANPTVDLPAPLPSQDTGWDSPAPPAGTGQHYDNGNGAIGVSGSDGYLEVSGDQSSASGHISGATAGQAGAVPLNGYVGNDNTGNGTVCVVGTKVA